jgi:hypothetical protein
MYCVMLGHDIPFAYVHALTMTQDPKIYNKRTGTEINKISRLLKFTFYFATGFLAVSLCLHENHELLLMVVNSIRKVLKLSCRFCTRYLPITPFPSSNESYRACLVVITLKFALH